jgi:hypothetical protein
VRGKKNRKRKVAAALTGAGEVALVGSNARGAEALRVRVGDSADRLPAGARRRGAGLFVRGAGAKARYVYGVRRGRIRFVGVATRQASKSGRALRRHLRLAGLR